MSQSSALPDESMAVPVRVALCETLPVDPRIGLSPSCARAADIMSCLVPSNSVPGRVPCTRIELKERRNIVMLLMQF